MVYKALNYWSVAGGLEGTLDPLSFLRICREQGFQAAELAIGPAGSAFGLDADDQLIRQIIWTANDLGLKLLSTASGLYWGRNLGSATEEERAGARADLETMLRISGELGAKTHLTIPGAVDVFFNPDAPVLPYEHVWHYATEGIRAVLPVAEEVGVRMGIENVWNKFLTSPQEMASFIDQFESPFVGAYVDVANLLPYGYAQDWIRHLGHRVVGVHFKDFRRAVGTVEGFVDLLEGDVDWPEVMAALREIRYDGAAAAELIPVYKHFPILRVRAASAAIDAIFAG